MKPLIVINEDTEPEETYDLFIRLVPVFLIVFIIFSIVTFVCHFMGII